MWVEVRCWWWVSGAWANSGVEGTRMGGVISKGGRLSLCGAAPRRFWVAPCNADVWREGGTGLDFIFPLAPRWKQSLSPSFCFDFFWYKCMLNIWSPLGSSSGSLDLGSWILDFKQWFWILDFGFYILLQTVRRWYYTPNIGTSTWQFTYTYLYLVPTPVVPSTGYLSTGFI